MTGKHTTVSIVVAIVGASGSGKSHLVALWCPRFGCNCRVLRVDDYYRDLAHLSFEDRDAINFDHPDAIEFERLVDDLASLRSGEEVQTPVYDFTSTRAQRSVSRCHQPISFFSRVFWPCLTLRLVNLSITRSSSIPRSNFVSLGVLTETLLREAAQRPLCAISGKLELSLCLRSSSRHGSEAVLVINGSQTIDDELSRVGDWLQARM